MLKDIVLNLEHSNSRDVVRDYAISIAERFEAHLVGLAFAGGIPKYMLPDFPADVLAQILTESERAAKAAVTRFAAATKRSDINAEHHLITQCEFGPAQTFSAFARRFDLSVLMQSGDGDDMNNDVVIETALFGSGRPVIVVPYIQKNGLDLDRVICCWDGSRAAARALNDSLPFLEKAGAVELLIVNTDRDKAAEVEFHGFEVGNHLARHDVNVEITTLSLGGSDVTNVILSHAADCSAGMIVMGGYGHSRAREFVLGGVTRGMLSSMSVPMFMSH